MATKYISKINNGIEELIIKDRTAEPINFVKSVSGTAGQKSVNRTKWTGSIEGITDLYTGLTISIKTPLVGVNVGVTIDINSLGEHPVVFFANTIVTTHFPVGSIIILTYDSTQTASVTINSVVTTITGCWKLSNYDSNTTYSAGTAALLEEGTDTSKNRVWQAKILADYVKGKTDNYAGGTAITLNGTNKGASTASFYAPTTAGEEGQLLKSNGSGAPTWSNLTEEDILLAKENYISLHPEKSYLSFITKGDCNFSFTNTVSYSLDYGKTWTSLAANTNIEVYENTRILWKGNITPQAYVGVGTFSSDYDFEVEGNLMSLIYGDNFIDTDFPSNMLELAGFYHLFYNCTTLVNAENLYFSSKVLKPYCYNECFYNCTALKKAPKILPATTLANNCYQAMFQGCTSLITAPELPATTLAEDCYFGMFYECTSLRKVPDLPATTLANYCYRNMFYNCSSMTTAPALPATTLAPYCYYSMFQDCTSLVTASVLPAITLANYCYSNMFKGCSSLSKAPNIMATTLASNCCSGMFENCTSLVQSPKLLATTLIGNCYYTMFKGCTSLEKAPELLATTLANGCYYEMFSGCSNLKFIKSLNTTTPSRQYTINWVSGVNASGIFIKNTAATWTTSGATGVPTGWTTYTENY